MSLDLSARIHYDGADLTVLAAIDRADLLRQHIILLAGLRVQATGEERAELNRRIGSQYKRWKAAMADARDVRGRYW